MAKSVMKDPYVKINNVDLSGDKGVKSLTIDYSAELQDVTGSGDDNRAMLAGLKDYTIQVEFYQNYDAAKVDGTLFDLVGAAQFAVEIRPHQTPVGTTNPSFTANMLLENYQPVAGTVGEVQMAPITLRPGTTGGALKRATSG